MVTYTLPTEDFFNSFKLKGYSEQLLLPSVNNVSNFTFKQRTDLAVGLTDGGPPLDVTDVNKLLEVLIYKSPIGKIPTAFIPPNFGSQYTNTIVEITKQERPLLDSY